MHVVLISTDENTVGVGVRTLSSCLLNNGFSTSVVLMATSEDNFRSFNWDDLAALCGNAGLIGISCMTHGFNKAVEIKAHLTGKVTAPIVIGGIHASLDPEHAVQSFSLVCHGEGEDLVVELARRIERNEPVETIPGLWLNIRGNIIRNAPLPLHKDLNDYPFPDYDIVHQYVLEADRLVSLRPVPLHIALDDFVILGSRGCPHHCTYCCNRKIQHEFPWRKKVVHYSIEYLMDHLKTVRRIFPAVRSFWIEDDTFFAKNVEEIKLFSRRYKEEIALPFQILISPWTYQREKLDPLLEAGMTKLIMGIQSGSEQVNYDLYDRKITNKRVQEIAHSLHQYSNLEKCYDFIGMNPFESSEDLINTINFLKSLPPPYFIFNNNLAFYPGTELHKKAVAAGIDVTSRVKHADPRVGYRILLTEKLQHKLFHLMLLMMAGRVTRFRLGNVPRIFVSGGLLQVLSTIHRISPAVTDSVAVTCAFVLYHCQLRKIIRSLLGPKTVAIIRSTVFKITGKTL
jgi:biotin synthase-like enzyme